MDKEVFLNEDEIIKIIESLKSKKEKLNEIIEKQKVINKRMIESWGGTSGEKAYEKIKKHERKYELYMNSINVRIEFLEKVRNSYIGFDNYINQKINNNGNM